MNSPSLPPRGAARLVELRSLYRRIAKENPQRRGQQLNGLVASLFDAWGHRARANEHRGPGEIDVTFAIRDTRFVLEAKWLRAPANEDAIGKLRDRVSKRLAGTIGVMLSMSGYTQPARENMRLGQRLELILIEREHLEAMLFEFLSPSDLFAGLLDMAHYLGEPLTPLTGLTDSSRLSDMPHAATDVVGSEVCSEIEGGTTQGLFLVDGLSGCREPELDQFLIASRGGLSLLNLSNGTHSAVHSIPLAGLIDNGSEVFHIGISGRGLGHLDGDQWRFTAASSADGEFISPSWWYVRPERSGDPTFLISPELELRVPVEHACPPMCVVRDHLFVAIQTGWSSPGRKQASDGQLWLFDPSGGDGELSSRFDLPTQETWSRTVEPHRVDALQDQVAVTTPDGRIYIADIDTETVELAASLENPYRDVVVDVFRSPGSQSFNVCVAARRGERPGVSVYRVSL